MATAAVRRTAISLIKSSVRGRREKRPWQSSRASDIKVWFLSHRGVDLTGENEKLSHSLFWHKVESQNLRIPQEVVLRDFTAQRSCNAFWGDCYTTGGGNTRRRIEEDGQGANGCNDVIDISTTWRLSASTTGNSALQFVEGSQFLMNGWRICMQTMLITESALCTIT